MFRPYDEKAAGHPILKSHRKHPFWNSSHSFDIVWTSFSQFWSRYAHHRLRGKRANHILSYICATEKSIEIRRKHFDRDCTFSIPILSICASQGESCWRPGTSEDQAQHVLTAQYFLVPSNGFLASFGVKYVILSHSRHRGPVGTRPLWTWDESWIETSFSWTSDFLVNRQSRVIWGNQSKSMLAVAIFQLLKALHGTYDND